MERKALSQFHAILRERHYHHFDPVSKTQPGLALSPKELLARVGKGLVSPIDIQNALAERKDDPEDVFPAEDESDLAAAYERNEAYKKELSARIKALKEKKAAEASEKKARVDALNEEEKLKKQAEALRKYIQPSTPSAASDERSE